MSIEILTMWYNESQLAPYFLKHYAWADKITILYDMDTTDGTLEIAKAVPNVTIIPFRFPDMMDDELKRDFINEQYKKCECDWILSVDADEFAFYKEKDEFRYDLKPFIAERSCYDMFYVNMYQVYRHKSDVDLDPSQYPIPQRRHGNPSLTEGLNIYYNKPILARSSLAFKWSPGCHTIEPIHPPLKNFSFQKLLSMYFHEFKTTYIKIAPFSLMGAHWQMADPSFAIERRVKNRKERQSRNNLRKGMTIQHHNITEESVRQELNAHLFDDCVF